jgi:hypothetical protein
MFFRSIITAAALAALTAVPVSAATAVTPNSGWVTFSFNDVGSSFAGEAFTFTLGSGGTLSVTDAFNDGDRFEIFDFGSSLGLTSVPTNGTFDISNDYDAALLDPRFSSAVFVLGAGSYSITGVTIDSPFGGGGAALRVDISDVPIPAAGLLLLTGLAGLAGLRRRKTT